MYRNGTTLFLLAALGFSLVFTGDLAAAAEVSPQWEKVLEAAKNEGQLV